MCEFCGSGPTCGVCGRGLVVRGPAWRCWSYLVDAAAFVVLAVVAIAVLTLARGGW